MSSLSHQEVSEVPKNIVLEPVNLTPEVLERLWKKLLNETKLGTPLAKLIFGRRVAFVDESNFDIITTDAEFEDHFAPFKSKVEEIMQGRDYTNNPAVHCRVVTEKAQKRSAYDPEEKFETMAKKNPAMESLRKLFPDLELG